jgi:hypothetical protein
LLTVLKYNVLTLDPPFTQAYLSFFCHANTFGWLLGPCVYIELILNEITVFGIMIPGAGYGYEVIEEAVFEDLRRVPI